MADKIENYKRKNAELAIKLNEKRVEIERMNIFMLNSERKQQQLQEENAQLKEQLGRATSKIAELKALVINVVRHNTSEYTKLMAATGALPARNQNAASSVQPVVASVQSNADVPKIVVSSPKNVEIKPAPAMALSPKPTNTTTEPVSRSPRTPDPYTPFGLSLITEENTLDLHQQQSIINTFRVADNEDGDIFHSTMITTVDLTIPNKTLVDDNDNENVTDENNAPEKYEKPKKDPLTSVQNIPQLLANKPAPASVKKLRHENALKDDGQSKSAKTKTKRASESLGKTNSRSDDTTGRPRRRAAPEHLKEPKLKEKLRRDK